MVTLFGTWFGLVEVAVVAVAGASAVVGLYVGYQAFRGLRRHDSRPMKFLSLGLVLLTAVTYLVAFLGTALLRVGVIPLPQQNWFRLLVRLTQFAGLACIAYSLHARD